jgi:predicted ATPase
MPPPRITKVLIRNYKSIGEVAVDLPGFCAFIGPNASGKSNFLDSLAFVRDCLADSVEAAFRNRGGISAVRRKSAGHPTHIALRLIVDLGNGDAADYAFELAAKAGERFTVAKERCTVHRFMGESVTFSVQGGQFTQPIQGIRPRLAHDRLALFAAAAVEEFQPLYEFLTGIRVYSIFPHHIRELQEPDAGAFLKRDGSNAAAILRRLASEDPEGLDRLRVLLAKVAPGVEGITYRPVGKMETIEFTQRVAKSATRRFDADNMSDGTLRVLGLLLAILQPERPSVVAIEEPELTVHPAVMELLVQVLLDASRRQQVLVSTHSPELLDYEELRDEQIRVVTVENNATKIAPLSRVTRDVIRSQLYTAGELLRIDELSPDLERERELAAEAQALFTSPQEAPPQDEAR